MYIGAVDAADRQIGNPECGTVDGALFACFVWRVAVDVQDLGIGKS
jgi:hypothetical protein